MRQGRGDQDGHGRSETSPEAAAAKTAKRSFNMAAHKLVSPGEERLTNSTLVVPRAGEPLTDGAPVAEPDVIAHASTLVLALGALGVVYGDIGTSPLYTEQTIFLPGDHLAPTSVLGIYGIVSLIFWSTAIMV